MHSRFLNDFQRMKEPVTKNRMLMYAKDSGYYANLNTALLEAIPLEAATVLDVGCATGKLGAAYKQRAPNARVIGVEVHAAAAAEAAQRLDMVLCCGVEAADLGFLKGRVDCIVYGDVLEHLIDPWSVLASHRTLLSERGVIVACIPNVQHWSLLEHLLRGSWTYSDHGLLDDTHLRFFTYQTIVAMFDRAGLGIDRMLGLLASPERAASLTSMLMPTLAALGVDRAGFEAAVGPLQYLVIATRR